MACCAAAYDPSPPLSGALLTWKDVNSTVQPEFVPSAGPTRPVRLPSLGCRRGWNGTTQASEVKARLLVEVALDMGVARLLGLGIMLDGETRNRSNLAALQVVDTMISGMSSVSTCVLRG